MDADGDFVISWQSLNQDKSGWGVYAQRYDPAGNALGGTDEVDVLTMTGHPAGSFTLNWTNPAGVQKSGNVAVSGSVFATISAVEQALNSMGLYTVATVTHPYVDVIVTAVSSTAISIEFTGRDYGGKDLAPITIGALNITGDPGRDDYRHHAS